MKAVGGGKGESKLVRDIKIRGVLAEGKIPVLIDDKCHFASFKS